ncbi:MAG: hypothetical protein HQM09_15075 [Candidatus Riflebacteria bacterium]|nr:hypothetical protein [Candidatus Riflebacteria bacterium]
MNEKVKVLIIGAQATGKPAIAELIRKTLLEHGMAVENPELVAPKHIAEILSKISGLPVVIEIYDDSYSPINLVRQTGDSVPSSAS